jgi:hypothetical protein
MNAPAEEFAFATQPEQAPRGHYRIASPRQTAQKSQGFRAVLPVQETSMAEWNAYKLNRSRAL